MLPGFREEHDAFRKSVRDFVDREVRPHALDWEAKGQLPRSLFLRLGELGFLGVRLSEAYGGSGLDFWYTAALLEELVRSGSVGIAVSILGHAEFSTKIIDRVGTEEQKREFLAPAIRGEKLGALGVTEPGAGSDVGAIATRAVRAGEYWVLNGSKTFITNGNFADFVAVLARTGPAGNKGLSLFIVPTDTPGFSHGKALHKIGVHASDTAELHFDDCKIPAKNLLGAENGGFRLIMEGFEGERLVLAVMICAQMNLMWEEARRYGHERKTFGRPILANQAWQHRLADALATITAAEALTSHAIDLYVRGRPANAEISMAKLFAAEAMVTIGHDCAQIFGGNRFMEEYLIARLSRDSLAFSVGAGTSEMMREIIARTRGLVPQGHAP